MDSNPCKHLSLPHLTLVRRCDNCGFHIMKQAIILGKVTTLILHKKLKFCRHNFVKESLATVIEVVISYFAQDKFAS